MLSQEQTFDDRDEWRLLADELYLLPAITHPSLVTTGS
ncbi:hypothetical protein FHR25_005216 [Yokenella regensburgei]|nr:hypothetical protein FHR25_005216 [Yokenella regensburgei]